MLPKPAPAAVRAVSTVAVCVVAAILLIGLAGPAAAAEQWSLRALMAELAKTRSGSVRYREERHLKTMTEPVVVTGTMAYEAPDRLVKIALTPQKETMVIEGDNLTIEREGGVGVQSLRLSEIPQLNSLITALRATLLGDREALLRHFEVRVRGTRSAWSMDLTPRTGGARGADLRITVDGVAGRPGRFEIRQPDGDRIVVQVLDK
ncbi:MAG: outer membrane lipoprotein carrier protein LolA [Alphaproteobacteria bacterium]|nr:outer membrane lipoprotein carrier protein LolA [Alphaproteobacteria bacterium]